MAFLSGWTYRKEINITGETGSGTNYQIKLLIGESSGATGEDFDLEEHSDNFPDAKGDGGDLRFTDDDEETVLDFWVESITGTTPNRLATVWVEVADDLGSNQSIYCYYGNSGASNGSDVGATFVFGDDFNDESLDTDKWTDISDVGATITEENDYLKLETGITTGTNAEIQTENLSNLKDVQTVIRMEIIQFDAVLLDRTFNISSAEDGDNFALAFSRWDDARVRSKSGGLFHEAAYTVYGSLAEDTIYRWKLSHGSLVTKYEMLNDSETSLGNLDTMAAIEIVNIFLQARNNNSTNNVTLKFYYLFIRNYNLTAEPDFSSAGAEEEAPSGTNIKSVNGLLKASIKSINGLAIASIKSINGLT